MEGTIIVNSQPQGGAEHELRATGVDGGIGSQKRSNGGNEENREIELILLRFLR
jgi:hypothetical protein